MPPLLTNVKISTSRQRKNAGTGVSGPAMPVLNLLPCFIHRTPLIQEHALPPVALESDYILKLDPGTDVQEGDYVTGIFRRDGLTPWPAATSTDTYHVVHAAEITTELLPTRIAYLVRVRTGGLPT